jgi:hypothetical protein
MLIKQWPLHHPEKNIDYGDQMLSDYLYRFHGKVLNEDSTRIQ